MRKIFIVVQITLFIWVETSPIYLDSDLDQLYEDLSNLSYSEEAVDDTKILDEDNDKIDIPKSKASRFKKQNTVDRGTENKYNIGDVTKYFKTVESNDDGTKDDGGVSAFLRALFSSGLAISGNETRTHQKGSKTRGFHKVHHKDEFKKEKEFFEDDKTSGEFKKIGARGTGIKIGGSAEFDKGFYHHDQHKGLRGKNGLSNVGSEKKQYSGYSDSQGFDDYFEAQ